MTKKEGDEICISNEKTIAEIESMQNDIKKKGEEVSKTEMYTHCKEILEPIFGSKANA